MVCTVHVKSIPKYKTITNLLQEQVGHPLAFLLYPDGQRMLHSVAGQTVKLCKCKFYGYARNLGYQM